jgi:methyl-accepting chemotaxis protein
MSLPAHLMSMRKKLLVHLPSFNGLVGRTSIGTRLALASAALLALTAALGVFAVVQLGVVKRASSEISDRWMVGVRLTSQMNTDASNFRIAEVRHILAGDAEERARLREELKAVEDTLQRHASAYAGLIASPEETKLLEAFKRERQRYLDEHLKMVRLSEAGQVEDAKALLTYNSQKKYEGASAALQRLVDHNITGGRRASEASNRTHAESLRWIVAVLIVAVAIGAALSIVIARSITRPLKVAASVADAVAGGDLTVRVPVAGADETGRLLQALRVMTSSLATLAGNVRRGSEQVATSSQQIAMGNADLSQRTERQAARLQQAATTMLQLDSAVRAIEASASGAARLVGGASNLADRGNALMVSLVGTMRRVTDAGERIGEIIALVDSIAFKTNILALNAAVEAARAGDSGRGFGVVAGEVRSLAQISAQAAKDIKQLVDESRHAVGAGSNLAGEAGRAMEDIASQVNSVSRIIGSISEATTAQARDISRVSEAVSQIDQATQQNAALVEQSAAAAEHLREQARHLVDAVAALRT